MLYRNYKQLLLESVTIKKRGFLFFFSKQIKATFWNMERLFRRELTKERNKTKKEIKKNTRNFTRKL